MKSLLILFFLLLSFGCTNRYINKAYVTTDSDIRTLSFYPVSKNNIHIKDSTVLDFIMNDFGVSKERAVVILDSLINTYISSSLVLYTDNVIISPCKINANSFSATIDSTKISVNDFQKLKQLDISLPNKNTQSSLECPADLVLIIQNMELDINQEVKLNKSGSPYSVENYYAFVAKNIAFVIWDYKKNCIVCSGKVNSSATAFRQNQAIIDSTMNTELRMLDNMHVFWPYMIRTIGAKIANTTPFSKHAIDSLINEDQWRTMKKVKLFHPQRDSAIIAGKLETIYPLVTKSIDNITTLGNRDSVRLKLNISPNGTIAWAGLLDSIEIDSAARVKLNKDISVKICDSITDSYIVTSAILIIRRQNTKDRVHIESINNVEGRSRASIEQIVINKCAGSLRNAYNRRLRDGMNMEGKITTKFAIDDNGKVFYSTIVSSTMNHPNFEKEIMTLIKSWKFDRIYNPGDVTEAVYPFIFTR